MTSTTLRKQQKMKKVVFPVWLSRNLSSLLLIQRHHRMQRLAWVPQNTRWGVES